MNQFCETCYFWVEKFKNEGWCKRYPKVLNPRSDEPAKSINSWVFPVTANDEFCGEWKSNNE